MIAKHALVLFLAFALVIAAGSALMGQEKETKVEHQYIGVKKCAICHKKDGIYPSWQETPHAKAWDALSEEQQKDEKCIACHTTGTDAEGELLTAVQCEACHGPGSDYKSMSTMKDLEKAKAAGLILPDETTCMKCHDQEKIPEEFRPEKPFDYATMKAKGLHIQPYKEAAKKEKGGEG
jgi:RecJ-like exonuclease